MQDQGFNVNIWLDVETGFLHGGNQFNCGTWMDKMGSAHWNRGQPATPRDGAPIELTALLYSSLRFMEELVD
jgi:glycogen debranching enzyme